MNANIRLNIFPVSTCKIFLLICPECPSSYPTYHNHHSHMEMVASGKYPQYPGSLIPHERLEWFMSRPVVWNLKN